jgi:hypothetical protein
MVLKNGQILFFACDPISEVSREKPEENSDEISSGMWMYGPEDIFNYDWPALNIMANPNVRLGDEDEILGGIAAILEDIRDELKKVNAKLDVLNEIRDELITLNGGEETEKIEYEGE